MAKQIKFNIRLNVDGKEQLVTATTNVKDLRKSLGQLKGSYSKLAEEALKFNQSLQAIQNISGVLNSITQESRDFSAAMKAANTMAGKGGEEFERLKDRVAELSKTVPMARDQLANGLYQVISNGVPENNWISYLEASAKSAVGGIADVGEVVKVTSTVIKNYGLEWSAAQDIQDKIQLTAKNGVTSFEQLAAALPSVTGQAAQLGVSFTEMLAVMSTLTGVTGNTAEVSTQLASVLTALTKESSKSQKMAEKMGISFNAASIKAAGGLQQFLTQLDQTITAYSAKTGELKESIYSKLFGRAEALRLTTALTGELSGKFAENITALENSAGTIDRAFETMSSTGSATIQMLKNQYAAVTDFIASITGGIQPMLTFTSQIGMTVVSIGALTKAMKSLSLTHAVLRTNVTRTAAAFLVFGGNAGKMSAAMRVMSAAAKGAAFQATALKIALRGLLTATGVGIALTALGVIIGKLCGNAEEAAESAKELSKEEEAYKNAAAEAKVKIDEEIKSLGSLIREKKNTAEAVKHLNDEYGGIFGKHKTAAEWYDTLTKKSKAYCQQLGYEAQMKVLTNKQAEKQIELDQNTEKRQALVKSGKHQNTSTTRNVYTGTTTSVTHETAEYTGLVNDAAKLVAEINGINAKLELARRGVAKASAELGGMPASGNSGSGGKGQGTGSAKPTATIATPEAEVTGIINQYEKRLKELREKISGALTEADGRAAVEEYNAVEKELKAYKVKIGLEKPDAPEIEEVKEKIESDLTIKAEVEPEYITRGSMWDKRQSYSNAQSKASRIQSDYDIGLITSDEAQKELDKINGWIRDLDENLKPIEIKLDTDKAENNLKDTADMIGQFGSSLSAVASNLELPELDVAGTIAQAVATMVQSYATASAQAAKLGPFAWMAFAATGLAQVTAIVASMKNLTAFADGGVVSGPTLALVGEYSGATNNPEVIAPLDKLRSMIEPATFDGGRVRFEIEGRKLVGVIEKEYSVRKRS